MRYLLLLLFYTQAFASYWTEDSVRQYVHHSNLQHRWALAFIAPHLKTLNGDEHILDIGCGDGKITADLSNFVPNGSVVGIDPSSAMIGWAKRQFSETEYPNLSFALGSFDHPNLPGNFDLIVSFAALQHCPSPQNAVATLHTQLKPGGKLLVLIPAATNQEWHRAASLTRHSPRWQTYWKSYAPRHFLSIEGHRTLLIENDFLVENITLIHKDDPFYDQRDLIEWLKGTYPPVVPAEEMDDFCSDLIATYLQLKPDSLHPSGRIDVAFEAVGIEATTLH